MVWSVSAKPQNTKSPVHKPLQCRGGCLTACLMVAVQLARLAGGAEGVALVATSVGWWLSEGGCQPVVRQWPVARASGGWA